MSEDDNISWYCMICIIESNADVFPFGNPTLNDFDVDENYLQAIDSKYYDDITDVMSLSRSLSNYFALFHTNVRSLAKHFDEVQSLLSTLQTKFDVIHAGISETKENIDKGFITNVDLSGYHMYTQPSKSAAGEVAIYVNDTLNHISKNNLNIIDDDFEAVW